MKGEDFTQELLTQAEQQGPFEPGVYYDADGDCLEFFVSNEPFKAQRLDKWVTVYLGRETQDVVGSLIKNVRELMRQYPGLDIDIEKDDILLSHMLRGPAYATNDPVKKKVYKAVLLKLDERQLRAPMKEALGMGAH